jgi:hypothetical protein
MVASVDACHAATEALATTVPTTLAGLAAVLQLIREETARFQDFAFDDCEDAVAFLASIEQAVRSMMPQV